MENKTSNLILIVEDEDGIRLTLRDFLKKKGFSAVVASDGVGAGVLELTTTSNSGATLFIGDIPSGDVINFTFPEDGILFPAGVFCKTKTNIAAYTLLTDKYSGPNLEGQNG